MIFPPPLKKKSTIGIVATARAVFNDDLRYAIDWLTLNGYQVKLAKNINQKSLQFAGDDEKRASAFQEMIDDRDVDAIWCAKGGYGSVRIIDQINFQSLHRKPKWFIGYSDFTVIHLALNNIGVPSLHAAMAVGLAEKSEATKIRLLEVLQAKPLQYQLKNTNAINRPGKASGSIIGGNLSVIYALLGSSTALDPKGKILFLEDLDEYLYHVDRMMVNLDRNYFFKHIKGLIIGSFNDMNDNTDPFGKSAYQIIFDVIKDYDFPVFFGFPAGHEADNYPLIFGADVDLEITQEHMKLNFRNGRA
ncbi:MAG: LD-carboxypeptidase [Psychroflexus sp.]|nr:LD-carboxypeptidase [Psychroflexus sp.]